MRRFAHAAILAVALSGPALVGVVMDNSAVSMLGAPSTSGGPCSGTCQVGEFGTAAGSSGGKVQGGYVNNVPLLGGGTITLGGSENGGGRVVQSGPVTDTTSGNLLKSTGHFTGNPGNCSGQC